MENKIEVGDKVYWTLNMGYIPIRISGKVLAIDGDELSIAQTTQNTYGKPIKKHISKVTKSKRQ